jgi:mono/diheme cytochrome c family protein
MGVFRSSSIPGSRRPGIWHGRAGALSSPPHSRRPTPRRLAPFIPCLFLILAGCREQSGQTAAHPPETVQRSYELHCLGCHGARGEGAWGSNIQGLKTSVTEITAVIANGAEKMPAFKGHLTDEQMRELAEYVKAFK